MRSVVRVSITITLTNICMSFVIHGRANARAHKRTVARCITPISMKVLLSPLPASQSECLGAPSAIRESHDALEMLGHDRVARQKSWRRLELLHALKPREGSNHPSSFAGHSPACSHGDDGTAPEHKHVLAHSRSAVAAAGAAQKQQSSAGGETVFAAASSTTAGHGGHPHDHHLADYLSTRTVHASDFVLSLASTMATALAADGGATPATATTTGAGQAKTSSLLSAIAAPTTQRLSDDQSMAAIVVSQTLNVVFSADASAQGRIYVWDINMWSLLFVSEPFDSCIMCLCVDDEHSLLCVGAPGRLKLVHVICIPVFVAASTGHACLLFSCCSLAPCLPACTAWT